MNSISHQTSAKDYIAELAARGQHHFTSADARAVLGVSADATKLALNRLARQGRIASPSRGFYVIVPPEYGSLGCLPADQFIPALMVRKQLSYYVGLLSAAQYYGAAHHRPQEFQVLLEKSRRLIRCGRVRVRYVARKRLKEVATRNFNTPRGEIRVSTPEATAVDLAGYPQHAGGLDNVATVLAELADSINPQLLPLAAATAPLPWAQRLGYVLEFVGAGSIAEPLKSYVNNNVGEHTPLVPGSYLPSADRSPAWKIIINSKLMPEA